MGARRNRLAELLLRSPLRLRSLKSTPLVGDWIHRLSHRLISSDDRVWAKVRYGPAKGIWLELNPRTGQDYALGRIEAPVQQALAEYLKPGMIFYDLGANIGLFSLLTSRFVGSSGQVFGFEPDPVTALRFRRNVEKNQASNVTVVEAGAGSVTGKFAFLCADGASPDRGVGRFVSGDEKYSGDSLQCYALDDFLLQYPAPHAIKCDVEGAEVAVIRGAEKLLTSFRPWLLIEVHSTVNEEEVRKLCSGLGYKTRNIDQNHLVAEP